LSSRQGVDCGVKGSQLWFAKKGCITDDDEFRL
jgi:hypothetical protein